MQKDSALTLFSKDFKLLLCFIEIETKNYRQCMKGGVYIKKTMLNCDQPPQNLGDGLALYIINDKYMYMEVF